MERHERKNIRLKEYDYSTPGAYFITVCTKDRKNYFWQNVGASIARPQDIVLTECGKVADVAISNISKKYQVITVDKYVIMPNHLHLLIQIHGDEKGRPMVAPTIKTVIQQMKGYVSKNVGFKIWQKSYYDHVVRGREDYLELCQYIINNPQKWAQDKFYTQ